MECCKTKEKKGCCKDLKKINASKKSEISRKNMKADRKFSIIRIQENPNEAKIKNFSSFAHAWSNERRKF